MNYTAVLIDINSIQQYIFGSNKLKLNIGASYIIEHEIFGALLGECLKDTVDHEVDLDAWQNTQEKIELSTADCKAEIGYIGGGNTLILFKDEENAKQFVGIFSKKILSFFPGLKSSFAIKNKFGIDDTFEKDRKELNKELVKNRQWFFRNVSLPKPGVTDECSYTGELPTEHKQGEEEISGEAKAKFNSQEKSKSNLQIDYKDQLKGFSFSDDLENIGQEKDKGYIAVVHIDGNNMGKQFMECKSLVELRKLSARVKSISQELMREIVAYVRELFDENGKFLKGDENIFLTRGGSNEFILPFRPLIAGGDDFTFITEGRLGIHIAEKFIEFLSNKKLGNQYMKACAGVAIVKTKYPFFKAYTLSEQLITEAKKQSKKNNASSELHYLIAGNGFTGEDYSSIINQQFSCKNGQLVYGPYSLEEQRQKTFAEFKKNLNTMLSGENKWPMNKLKELRNTIRKDDAEIKYFIETLKARGLKLPEYDGKKYHEKLWDKDGSQNETPYYDMIELIDFYPQSLLNS